MNAGALLVSAGASVSCAALGYLIGWLARTAVPTSQARRLATRLAESDALDANTRRVRQKERDVLAGVLVNHGFYTEAEVSLYADSMIDLIVLTRGSLHNARSVIGQQRDLINHADTIILNTIKDV